MTDLIKKARRDLDIVAAMIPEDASVLDLGCGDGNFLKRLMEEKHVHALGIECSDEEVANCIANGVPVVQGDLNHPLDFAADGSFDCVIVSHTLQQVKHPDLLLREIVRVGKRAIVSFINIGHIKSRVQLICLGRMPRHEAIPYQWYNTPNIHLGTIRDFRALCEALHIEIMEQVAIGATKTRTAGYWTNLFAYGCVFELRGKQ